MADWLLQQFNSSTTYIDDTLRTAVGGAGDSSKLPYQSNFYSTHVANFLADGVWLVDDDNKFFLNSIEEGKRNIVSTM